MGSVQPSREQQGDIEFGWPLLKQIVDLEVGQAMAVRERDVICVEAAESTEAMIDRAGELCRAKGWTLLKTGMDPAGSRLQPPAITVETIERLARAGGGCLALGAGRVTVHDRKAVIETADKAHIAVVGVVESGPV